LIFKFVCEHNVAGNKQWAKFGGFSENPPYFYPSLLLPTTILSAINKRTKVVKFNIMSSSHRTPVIESIQIHGSSTYIDHSAGRSWLSELNGTNVLFFRLERRDVFCFQRWI